MNNPDQKKKSGKKIPWNAIIVALFVVVIFAGVVYLLFFNKRTTESTTETKKEKLESSIPVVPPVASQTTDNIQQQQTSMPQQNQQQNNVTGQDTTTPTPQQSNNSAGQSQTGSSTFSSATGILVNSMGESFIFNNGIRGYNGIVRSEHLVDEPIGDFGETKDGRTFVKKSEIDRCRPNANATYVKFLGNGTVDEDQGNKVMPENVTLVGDYYIWQSDTKSPTFTPDGYDRLCWQYFGKDKAGKEIAYQSYYPHRAVDLGAKYDKTIL